MARPIRYWSDLTSAEAAALGDAPAVALLPLAAIEQHGPHLPLSTDADINTGLVAAAHERLDAGVPVVVLPMLPIGDSTEHGTFAGTLALEPETLIRAVCEIGAAVAHTGVRRLVLFSSHGGNRAAIDIAALRLRRDHGLLTVKADYYRFAPPDDALPAAEVRHGIHGGALETAMMLHLRPEAVRRDAIDTIRPAPVPGGRLAPEGGAPFAWMAEDLHRDGIAGDPRLADAALGRTLVAHFAAILAQVLAETSRTPPPGAPRPQG